MVIKTYAGREYIRGYSRGESSIQRLTVQGESNSEYYNIKSTRNIKGLTWIVKRWECSESSAVSCSICRWEGGWEEPCGKIWKMQFLKSEATLSTQTHVIQNQNSPKKYQKLCIQLIFNFFASSTTNLVKRRKKLFKSFLCKI